MLMMLIFYNRNCNRSNTKKKYFENKYTHRQKLSNSKLVLNIKKCFVPKYWKFKFYYLHLTSFE